MPERLSCMEAALETQKPKCQSTRSSKGAIPYFGIRPHKAESQKVLRVPGSGKLAQPPPSQVRLLAPGFYSSQYFKETISLSSLKTRSPRAASAADPPRTPPASQRPPPGARQPANHSRRAPRSRFQGALGRPRTGSPSLTPKSRGGEPQLRPPPRGREWRRPAPRGQPESLPGGNPGDRHRRRRPAACGGRRRNEVTSGRSRRRRLWRGAARGVGAAEQVPARRRRLPQCPPPHCFPSKRLPAKPSPGTRKFPGATPPAAAMETAPASQGGSPGTPPPRRRPRPPHGPPPTVAAAAAAAAILARPGGPFPAARARRSRVPAGRGGALPGLRGADAAPGDPGREAAPLTPGRQGSEDPRRTADPGPGARLRGTARKRPT
ncbi:basic proline-rich protein-like [Lynx canadensis]|uniref:basic proline-rich protein-like n=1 Tax=Lynx canadensis TaxID=61383 RepID=UPI0011B0ADDC|nr:basic proline-rich protein-like [Lynx canadensis]